MLFNGKLVDNMPKCIPIENFLNTDIERCHDRLVVVINLLPKDDTRKLSNRASTAITCGIKCIVKSNGVEYSISDRIIQHYNKPLDPIWTVYQEKVSSYMVQWRATY